MKMLTRNRLAAFVAMALLALTSAASWLLASGAQTSQMIFRVSGANTLVISSASTASGPIDADWTTLLSSGTGANQASNIYTARRTLASGATENLDLYGSLTNAFGVTLNFTKIKAIMVKADSANTNDVQVQRASSNGVPLFMAASDGVQLRPGAWFVYVQPDSSGIAVTSGTGDILTFTNSTTGSSVIYDILIIGVD